ncbi:hypothetical protein SJAV_03130 [Sulfurisphaera javensis]|uniref:Uncharacterized protein n=1 Tax=Sulfurisphaera javensis TaxID=2049879 RepID=A0AAT9GN97_9CREN
MSIPWNVIDDKNIYLSHKEYLSKISSIKPIYEDTKQINIKKTSPLLLFTYTILSIIIIFISFFSFYLFSLILIPLWYLLGTEVAKNVDPKFLSFYLLFSSIFFLSEKIGIIVFISFSLLLYSFFSHRKGKMYLAFSVSASNLLYDIIIDEAPFILFKSQLRLSPYKLSLSLLGNHEGVIFNDFIEIYAINKGRVGILVCIEYYLKDLRKNKFKEFLDFHFEYLKGFLISKLNQKEWVLG